MSENKHKHACLCKLLTWECMWKCAVSSLCGICVNACMCVYIDMHVRRRHVNLHEPIQNTMLSMRLQRKKRNQVRERETERPTTQC